MGGTIKEAMTADGTVKARVFHPVLPSKTGVVLYMDAFGPRAALEGMAARMAAMGHVVLLPDLFYRAGTYGPFDAATAFTNEVTRGQLMALIGATSQDLTVRDTSTFLEMLKAEGATGPVATVGYCMGGARALNAAAAYPERIKAAASFHGGNLASDQPDSPHLRVGSITGRVYVGSAGVDRSFPPEQAAKLEQALRAAEIDHVIEDYVGCQHGWCVPDHSVYDAVGAERHWRRLETFLGETLRTS